MSRFATPLPVATPGLRLFRPRFARKTFRPGGGGQLSVTRPTPREQVTLKSFVLGTKPTPVRHGLGREPSGWLVLRKHQPGDVWEPTAHEDPANWIVLQASSPVTIVLRVLG